MGQNDNTSKKKGGVVDIFSLSIWMLIALVRNVVACEVLIAHEL